MLVTVVTSDTFTMNPSGGRSRSACRSSNFVTAGAIALTAITAMTFAMMAWPASANPLDPAVAKVQLFQLVNTDRVAAGLSPLTLRGDLDDIATAHSQRMADAGDIFHNDELFTSDTKARIGAKTVGENVAFNSSVADAHRRLMASPGHRANIMSSTFSIMGIGLVNVSGIWYITEVFIQPTTATGAIAPSPAPAPGPAPAPAPAPAPSLAPPAEPAPAPGAAGSTAPAPAAAASPVEAPVEAATAANEPAGKLAATGESDPRPGVTASAGENVLAASLTGPVVLGGAGAFLALALGMALRLRARRQA